jgi:hypothetical protein
MLQQKEEKLSADKNAILNHANLKSDFTLICQCQSQHGQTIHTSHGLVPEVSNAIIEKVCNTWLNEAMYNHTKQNAL